MTQEVFDEIIGSACNKAAKELQETIDSNELRASEASLRLAKAAVEHLEAFLQEQYVQGELRPFNCEDKEKECAAKIMHDFFEDDICVKAQAEHEIELGNMLFGHSRGAIPLDPRNLYEEAYTRFLEKTDFDGYGMIIDKEHTTDDKVAYYREDGGYDCELFTIKPYYWGDDEEEQEKPNFVYKPTGLEIRWYKYPFRDAYANQNIMPSELDLILQECANYINDQKQ